MLVIHIPKIKLLSVHQKNYLDNMSNALAGHDIHTTKMVL